MIVILASFIIFAAAVLIFRPLQYFFGIMFMIYLLAFVSIATAGEQTRVYDAQGRSVGTATPESSGSVRYRDSRGKSLGTSTTIGGTTTYYGPDGRRTGSSTRPQR